MSTRIAFLRAVNVGARTVRNARLAELVEGLGYSDVWTYINSGNVVFDATGRRKAIERSISDALEADHGFEVTTFVRTPAELRSAMAAQPFPVDDGDTYFLTFLRDPPSSEAVSGLEGASNDFDTLVVIGRDVHWRMRGKSTDTTVSRRVWNTLGPNSSTSRNTTMIVKLLDKIDQR